VAIRQADLQSYSAVTVTKTLREAKDEGKPTAFLSHSHKDAYLAKGVQGFLRARGWDVYIDWEDVAMPDVPNRATAERIQRRIQQLELFLFLATANSMSSRWCPWEIGYADGVKRTDAILVLPTQDNYGAVHGNEYLQLYRHVDIASGGGVGHFGSDNRGSILEGSARP
jgi:hypothetical protein